MKPYGFIDMSDILFLNKKTTSEVRNAEIKHMLCFKILVANSAKLCRIFVAKANIKFLSVKILHLKILEFNPISGKSV